jgi:hypothetical protein
MPLLLPPPFPLPVNGGNVAINGRVMLPPAVLPSRRCLFLSPPSLYKSQATPWSSPSPTRALSLTPRALSLPRCEFVAGARRSSPELAVHRWSLTTLPSSSLANPAPLPCSTRLAECPRASPPPAVVRASKVEDNPKQFEFIFEIMFELIYEFCELSL